MSHATAGAAPAARPTRVQLLVTCLVDSLFPDVGFSVVNVLERLGVQVDVPAGQTCCGQPAFNAGSFDDARAMARHLVDVFDRSDVPVVVPSGSCGDMVIHQAPALLADDPVYGERARKLAARTYEFTAFLVDVLGVSDVGRSGTSALRTTRPVTACAAWAWSASRACCWRVSRASSGAPSTRRPHAAASAASSP